MRPAPNARTWSQPFWLADMASGRTAFSLTPDAGMCQEIATELGLLGLRKLRFVGDISPNGASDWHLRAKLGATVDQPCVLSLDRVTTRIEDNTSRLYLAGSTSPKGDGAYEMPDDETVEPLGKVIDVGLVMVEALALALPQYPRAPGVKLRKTRFAAPSVTPMTDADARAFAGLKALRENLNDEPE
jgi:hypothetical protein